MNNGVLTLRLNGFRLYAFTFKENTDGRIQITQKGNLIAIDKRDAEELWESETTGEENYAVLRDDGSLAVYDRNNKDIWSTSIQTSKQLIIIHIIYIL